MRTLQLVPVLFVALTSLTWAQDYAVGDRVLADFRKEGRWFPAVVVEVLSDKGYKVVYQDGFKEKRGHDQVRADSMRAGSKVDAPKSGAYAPATVEKRLDDVALVVFEDGSKAWNGVGKLGIKTENLDEGKPEEAKDLRRVMATWGKDATTWFPGVVVETGEKGNHVVYEDGSAAWRSDEQVKDAMPRPGDTVLVKLPKMEKHVEATLRTIIGSFAVKVRMPDKTHVWTALSRIKVSGS